MTAAPVNQHAPIRPRYIENHEPQLMFATMPQFHLGERYQVTAQKNMIAQMRLYRAVRAGEIPMVASIEEIYNYVFFDCPSVSKNAMGATVIRTVLFNPRKLKGVTKDNDKARSTYSFNHVKEFEYGLEWMICTWLRKFLNESAAPGSKPISGPDMLAEELDVLSNTSEKDYMEIYEEPVWETRYADPDWRSLVSERNERLELVSERPKVRAVRPEPPKSYNINRP